MIEKMSLRYVPDICFIQPLVFVEDVIRRSQGYIETPQLQMYRYLLIGGIFLRVRKYWGAFLVRLRLVCESGKNMTSLKQSRRQGGIDLCYDVYQEEFFLGLVDKVNVYTKLKRKYIYAEFHATVWLLVRVSSIFSSLLDVMRAARASARRKIWQIFHLSDNIWSGCSRIARQRTQNET